MLPCKDSPVSIPYREVLEVGTRLEKVWKERRTGAFLAKIEHQSVKRPISSEPVPVRQPLICRSPQAEETQTTIKHMRKFISSTHDILDSPLHFRRYTLADPSSPGNSVLAITYTSDLKNSSVPSLPHLHTLSPPVNSTAERRGSLCSSLVVSNPPRPDAHTTSTSYKAAKPVTVPRPPRVYSISTGYHPLCKLPISSDSLFTSSSTHVSGRKSPLKRMIVHGGSSPVVHGSKSPTAMCSAKTNEAECCSRVNQYVPPVVRSPLARPQALLPFNPKRTSKQFRQEVMALGPPPQIKPMVMTEPHIQRPKSTHYDLTTKGAANLLKFDRLEFRVHRSPSAGSAFVTGTYYSNGAFQTPPTPRSLKRADITGRNVIITEFDAEPKDVPFSSLLDVR